MVFFAVRSYPSSLLNFTTEEICDGLDNDCDSNTDEDLASIACGIGNCKSVISSCINGEEQICIPGNSEEEICDNTDNDCDGDTDENSDDICDNGYTCRNGECIKKSILCDDCESTSDCDSE